MGTRKNIMKLNLYIFKQQPLIRKRHVVSITDNEFLGAFRIFISLLPILLYHVMKF